MGSDGAPIVDPRRGDVGDDAARYKQRSLLAIAGSLLVEISLPKLLFACTVSLLLPAVLLGVAPLVVSAWLATLSGHILQLTEIGCALVLVVVVALGWIGWRPLFRIAEANFWSLNALAVQPAYAFCREALRHLVERMFARHSTATSGRDCVRRVPPVPVSYLRMRAIDSHSRLAGLTLDGQRGRPRGAAPPHRPHARQRRRASLRLSGDRVAHLGHCGCDHGPAVRPYRIRCRAVRQPHVAHCSPLRHSCGRRTIRFSHRKRSRRPTWQRSLDASYGAHRGHPFRSPARPLLVSGDMTDAGRATEWAEFLDAVAQHPGLAARMIVLPGNHDVNIVDRANPARLDLPFSPGKRLRQMRTLSAIAAVQGDRVRVVAHSSGNSADAQRSAGAASAKDRGLREAWGVAAFPRTRGVFDNQFPMILSPDTEDGLGVAILNSNAQTHFSFTNALGLVSVEQGRRLAAAIGGYPKARWIIALHHHLIEYPMPVGRSRNGSAPRSSTAAGSSASSGRSPPASSSCTATAISTGSARAER